MDKTKIARSVQRSIVFTGPQYAFLERERKKLGLSISEMIRRIVDLQRASKAPFA